MERSRGTGTHPRVSMHCADNCSSRRSEISDIMRIEVRRYCPIGLTG